MYNPTLFCFHRLMDALALIMLLAYTGMFTWSTGFLAARSRQLRRMDAALDWFRVRIVEPLEHPENRDPNKYWFAKGYMQAVGHINTGAPTHDGEEGK